MDDRIRTKMDGKDPKVTFSNKNSNMLRATITIFMKGNSS